LFVIKEIGADLNAILIANRWIDAWALANSARTIDIHWAGAIASTTVSRGRL